MAQVVNISEVCTEIFAGGDAPKNRMSTQMTDEFSVPIYSNGEAQNGLYGYTNFARVTEPSITVSARGTIGYAAIRNEPFVPIVRLISLTPNKKHIDIRYLYYAVQNYHFDGSGTSIPQLTVPMIKQYSFPLPEMDEQLHIASVLDKIVGLISLRKQQLEKLDELVKARFVEMFGDPATLCSPNKWPVERLGNCCIINPKRTLNLRLTQNTSVSFVPMTAISENGVIDTSDVRKYDDTKTGFTYFEENDVIFAKITPCMENGKGAIARRLHNKIGFGSTEFHILRPINQKSNAHWLYTLTKLERFRMDAAKNMTGSAGQKRVPVSYLESYKVVLPPIELQDQFAVFAENVEKRTLTIQQSLAKLEVLKKALMQEYFGGAKDGCTN